MEENISYISSYLSLEPVSVSHTEAAALPVPFLTAWEAIFNHGRGMKPAMRILVMEASGVVGQLAVEIASSHGTLKTPAAHDVIEYKTQG